MPAAAVPQHLSARELAEMKLAALPHSKRAINDLARREAWPSIDRIGQGGGCSFLVSALPLPAQADLQERITGQNVVKTPKRGRPKGTCFFGQHPDVAEAVRAELGHRRISSPVLLEKLTACGQYAELPSIGQLKRFVAKLEKDERAALTFLRDPDLFRNTSQVALGDASAGVTYAHELWEIDTTPADVLTLDGRKHILQITDRWSRRVRFLVVDSESARSVSKMLASTMLAWGVTPTAILTDHGSGYINASVVSSFEMLGIEHQLCLPGQPWRKPHVERLFGTFTRERAEILEGYTGHSVADAGRERAAAKRRTGRAEIVAALTADELQQVCDGWAETYHSRRHSKLGISPREKWQSTPTAARAAPTADKLTLALSRYEGVRTVGKKGVQCFKTAYWSPVCVELMNREVIVRSDERDLGCIHLFSLENEYLATAVNHSTSGLSQKDFALEATREQAEWKVRINAEDRERRRNYDPIKAAQALRRREAEAANTVINFPTPTIPHSTPQLDSMVEPPRFTPSAETTAILDAIATAPTNVTQLPKTTRQKIAEADALIADAAVGKPVDEARLRAARAYAASAEYRAIKDVDAALAATGARA